MTINRKGWAVFSFWRRVWVVGRAFKVQSKYVNKYWCGCFIRRGYGIAWLRKGV